jgi:hypothetical protein
VFDTNHEGHLGAGHASFNDFFVIINADGTRTAKSLASLSYVRSGWNVLSNIFSKDLQQERSCG